MILSALLIWFLISTEMLVNVFFFFFFVRKSLSYFQGIIHGFANKVRQSYRGEFNFV